MQAEDDRAPCRWRWRTAVAFAVLAVATAVVAVSLRVGGFLSAFDEAGTMSDAFERGRAQGAATAVLLGLAAGLVWISVGGALTGASCRQTLGRAAALLGVAAGVSLVSALWVTTAVLALGTVVLAVLRRRHAH